MLDHQLQILWCPWPVPLPWPKLKPSSLRPQGEDFFCRRLKNDHIPGIISTNIWLIFSWNRANPPISWILPLHSQTWTPPVHFSDCTRYEKCNRRVQAPKLWISHSVGACMFSSYLKDVSRRTISCFISSGIWSQILRQNSFTSVNGISASFSARKQAIKG